MRFHLFATLLALSVPTAAQNWFDAPYRPTHQNGGFQAFGDVDGDGDQDLLRAFGHLFTVHWNAGDGFMTEGPSFTLPADLAHGDVDLVDIDGDGLADLFAPHDEHLQGVAIQLGQGDGTFAAPISIPLTVSPHGVAFGQADADPEQEIAVLYGVHPNVTLRWIDFAGGAPVLGAALVNPDFGPMVLLDHDGDGRDDCAVGVDNSVAIHPTQPDLSFGAPVVAVAPFASDASQIAAGDIEGDGDEDLLVLGVSLFTEAVSVFETVGPGQTVVHPAQNAVTFPYVPFQLVDRDLDGDLDFFQHFGVTYLHENVDGVTFGPSIIGDKGYTSSSLLGLADMNGDGIEDMVMNHEIAFGDGVLNGLFPDAIGFEVDEPVYIPFHGAVDLEPDGDLDVAAGATAYVNDGAGNLIESQVFPDPPVETHGYGGGVVHADVNGDGQLDYVTMWFEKTDWVSIFIEMRLLAGDGLGSYVDQGAAAPLGVRFPGMTADWPLKVADLDDDGDLDVVAEGEAHLNDGTGFFATTIPIATGPWTEAVDLDGDGDDDLVTLLDGAKVLRVLHQTAPLVFATTDHAIPSFPVMDVSFLRLMDLDGDGILDATTGDIGGAISRAHLFRGDGTTLLPPVTLPESALGFQGPIASVDVDGDGVLDLVTGSEYVHVYPGLGPPLAYGEPRVFRTPSGVEMILDLDGDGDLDLLGEMTVRSRKFAGPSAGSFQQYGAGTAGTAGAVPVLGASGPVRPGGEAAVHLALGLGGAPTWLVLSSAEANVPDFPVGGLTALVDPLATIAVLPILAPGAGPGAGAWTLPVPEPIVVSLVGQSIYHQVFALDGGAAAGLAQTNGLVIQYGQ